MDITKAVGDLFKASEQIEKRHRYPCGIEKVYTSTNETKKYFFFNSPDGQKW